MGWTPELSEKCLELAKQGLSAGTILRELDVPGLSRSAVIAKIHRSGLNVGGGRHAAQERDHSVRRRKKSTRPKETRHRNNAAAYRIASRYVPPLAPLPPPEPAEFLGLTLEQLELRDGKCRYPRGDGPFLFCGQPVREDSSYCLYCHSLCWTPRDRSRDKVK